LPYWTTTRFASARKTNRARAEANANWIDPRPLSLIP
jgi:hypothetical protein